jgi:hypothetical protein
MPISSSVLGDFRRPVAFLRTISRVMIEYFVTLTGTLLFGITIQINYVNEARKRAMRHYGDSRTYRIKKARWKVKWGTGY